MPVPASINDLSTTAGSNSPPGYESPATIDDYLRAHAAFIAQLRDGKIAASAVSAFMLTVLDDADAATARATLGANNAGNLTAGSLPDERITRTGPFTPTMLNSYTNAGKTRYWKVGGIVFVQIDVGRASTPSVASPMFVLPDGYRPPEAIDGPGFYGQSSPLSIGAMQWSVATDGGVSLQLTGLTAGGGTGYSAKALLAFPAA